MDLALNEDQRLLVDSADRLLAVAASSAKTRAAAAGLDGMDRSLWQQTSAMGWLGVHLPENLGGLGLGLVELVLLQEQLGRRLACVPFLDSVVGAASLLRELVAEAEARSQPVAASVRYTHALVDGASVGTWAMDEDGQASGAVAVPAEGGWILTGQWPTVGSAAQADLLLLSARDVDGQPCLFAVRREHPAVQVTARAGRDTTRRHARVQVDLHRLEPEALLARGDWLQAAMTRARFIVAIGLAAEQLGVAQQCLDLSVAYTQQRVQFGQPIARFQAVKHRCAQMMVAVESARSAVYGAAAQCDSTWPQGPVQTMAALCMVEATEAAQFCAQEAIQLHGGVGFTWDYDPQLYFKRAQANSQRLGPVSAWCERVAVELLGGVQR